MTKFSEGILAKIKCEHIEPVARWHFLLKSFTFWSLFFFSVFLGSLSFSVVLHILQSGDLDVFNHLHGNLLTSVVMLLPFFWLLFLILFATVAYFNWKCTRHGYRYKRRWIVLGSVALSVCAGSLFNFFGLGRQIDILMTRSLPMYNQSKHAALREVWFHPERGFLTGKIIEIDEVGEKLFLTDETGKVWEVVDRNVKWENRRLEEKGKIIKVIGSKNGENNFAAKEIRRCGNCQDDEE